MKDLSIEEKAKAYDEAIERTKGLVDFCSDNELKTLEFVFSELKESGNIRIIKAIKYGLDHVFTNNTTVFEVTKEQCLAWLEKQGENTHNKELSELLHKVICRFINDPNIPYTEREKVSMEIIPYVERLEKQGEQEKSYDTCDSSMIDNKKSPYGEKRDFGYFEEKSAWSEEDEENFEKVINSLSAYGDKLQYEGFCHNKEVIQEYIAWLKSLKGRVQPQLKQEWSEDVEDAISLLKDIAEEQEKDYCPYNANNLRKAAQYLETCRPQNRWKPSDEQLEALDNARHSNSFDVHVLDTLFHDLKKLREE